MEVEIGGRSVVCQEEEDEDLLQDQLLCALREDKKAKDFTGEIYFLY